MQCQISLWMCCLRHPEHHARNRTSLAGLEQDLLFFGPPYMMSKQEAVLNHSVIFSLFGLSPRQTQKGGRKEAYERQDRTSALPAIWYLTAEFIVCIVVTGLKQPRVGPLARLFAHSLTPLTDSRTRGKDKMS